MDYNTVIIGSGVAGMTAAIYLARAGISVCILEKEVPGGQITRTSTIENYPGFKNIDGPELATNIYQQVLDLGVPYLYKEAEKIAIEENKKIVQLKDKTITCQNIIIATGRSPKKLGIENEESLIGRGISYCAICDGGLYKNQEVAVIGGGMAALEEALYLSKICSKVTLIHRRDEFRAEEDIINTVKETQNIRILINKRVEKFTKEDGKLKSIILKDEENKEEEIQAAACFEYIGQIPNTNNFKDLDIINNQGYIEVNETYETREPGIYAVGDCIQKELYQIITACSEGAIASSRIIREN